MQHWWPHFGMSIYFAFYRMRFTLNVYSIRRDVAIYSFQQPVLFNSTSFAWMEDTKPSYYICWVAAIQIFYFKDVWRRFMIIFFLENRVIFEIIEKILKLKYGNWSSRIQEYAVRRRITFSHLLGTCRILPPLKGSIAFTHQNLRSNEWMNHQYLMLVQIFRIYFLFSPEQFNNYYYCCWRWAIMHQLFWFFSLPIEVSWLNKIRNLFV